MPDLKMTPSDLELLIHCHVCAASHPRITAPAIAKGVVGLLKEDLIYRTETVDVYNTTPRGIAHVKQLCALPLPSIGFVDYKGEKI